MHRLTAAALAASFALACAPADDAPTETAATEGSLIYGADDRREPYERNDALANALTEATSALFDAGQLRAVSGGYVLDVSSRFGAAYGLCADEPYRNQPSSAFCTGFLVAPDLMVTAGHCIDDRACRDVQFVFGFAMQDASTVTATVPASDVYGCADIIARAETSTDDYAVVRLDRAVAGRAPLAVRRSGSVSLGDAVTVAGHPAGLPLKIAGGATVRGTGHPYYFEANVDTYGGNSGSPVVAADGTVEGILVRGNADFTYDYGARCYVSNECPDGGCPGWEGITRASRFVDHVPADNGGGDPLCESDAACDDGDPCTDDICEPATGCRNEAIACGAGASCVEGICVEDEPPMCLPRGADCGSNAECCSNRCHWKHGCR